jgi:hypothetical protein
MNKFNRILLASGLAATASLMANSPAFAGTTGTIYLSGTIATTLAINVSGNPSPLDLSGGSHSGVEIGSVASASSNSQNGLKVVLTSNWALTSGGNSIPITKISEAAGVYTSAPTQGVLTNTLTASGYTLVNTQTTQAGSAPTSTIFIDYIVPNGQAIGTYTGSITFTVSDK